MSSLREALPTTGYAYALISQFSQAIAHDSTIEVERSHGQHNHYTPEQERSHWKQEHSHLKQERSHLKQEHSYLKQETLSSEHEPWR